MIAKALKKLLPYSVKLRLRETILGLYGIPYNRHGVPGPLVERFRNTGPIQLIDVGASSGEFTESFSKFCGVRKALLIEPIPKRCEQLRGRFGGSNFQIVCGVVGDREAEMKMEVLKWEYSSSILPVMRSDANVTSKLNAMARMESALDVAEAIITRMQSLDQICSENGFTEAVDLLKIDVQGAEHLVLDGARKVLQRTQAIWTEVSFRPLYEGSLTFEGISARCREAGFILVALDEGFRGANGELLQGDALFIRA
jgi:FkbM family methyltransferase